MTSQLPIDIASARPRRQAEEPPRPIAAALQLPAEHVSAIDDSHDRCAAFGLSRFESPDFAPVPRADLAVARERNQRLHTHAAPVMELLHEQIVHTQSMVVLCDAAGTVIHAVGDDDFLARASKVALMPGANWSEARKGTNAVGTALVAERPTLVHADEHYFHANHFLTCSAAPILDPRGNVLGVLDVSGDNRSYHPHTMALVTMSARMIENHWLSQDFRHVLRVHFHPRPGYVGTLMEGILAIGPDGRIAGANRSATDLLGTTGAALRQHTLGSLFGTTVGALADLARSPQAGAMVLHTADGRALQAVVRFNAAAEGVVAAADRPAAPALVAARPTGLGGVSAAGRTNGSGAAPTPSGAALAALCTGDAQVAALAQKARRVLDRDIPILLVGETGTGKRTWARALHADSHRAARPFVAVDCASIPTAELEAELFGRNLPAAQGGTLFLRGVGELPLPAQARLLRLLQGEGDGVAPDIALICATTRPLQECIAAGTFRDDLYYRLDGLALRLPPLRLRSDVLPLAQRLLATLAERAGQGPGPAPALSPEAAERLRGFHWPGNLRQLHNALRSALALADGAAEIRREHLPDEIQGGFEEPPGAAATGPMATADPVGTVSRPLADVERDAIRRALDAAGGNVSVAARQLGVSRNTIYRRLRA